jgi:hypothetical protein
LFRHDYRGCAHSLRSQAFEQVEPAGAAEIFVDDQAALLNRSILFSELRDRSNPSGETERAEKDVERIPDGGIGNDNLNRKLSWRGHSESRRLVRDAKAKRGADRISKSAP